MRRSLVWFKKDLRVHDHQPLVYACDHSHVVAIYILEDEWLSSAEYSNNQSQFLKDCLFELDIELKKLNIPFILQKGSCLDIFESVYSSYKFDELISHYETGVNWTYQRDEHVGLWCNEKSINWIQHHQYAVIRKLKNRDTWNRYRKKIINRDSLAKPLRQIIQSTQPFISTLTIEELFTPLILNRNVYIQEGGRKIAMDLLDSFLYSHGFNYSKGMPSPTTAYTQCSRLSPHITWGTISLTEIQSGLTAAKSEIDFHQSNKQKMWLRSLSAFEKRLWWHCHFIQKLESEPEIEFKNINSGFDGMREDQFNESHFLAWQKGETGFPIIDACMRALIKHGWINFRMRAMLISFASYQLWLHWIKPAQYLAKLFTDFETGIHYSQVQMQSGVTGINAIRIYSPIKQANDQDPDGNFI